MDVFSSMREPVVKALKWSTLRLLKKTAKESTKHTVSQTLDQLTLSIEASQSHRPADRTASKPRDFAMYPEDLPRRQTLCPHVDPRGRDSRRRSGQERASGH